MVESVERDYVGFSVELVQGSRAKKLLSNRLSIQVDDSRTSTTINLTRRQARALRNFLDENLD